MPVQLDCVDGQNYDATRPREVDAESCGFQLLLVIPIMVNSRQNHAHQLLRGQAGDSVITNVRVRESWTYALVGTVYCTELFATAYPRLP